MNTEFSRTGQATFAGRATKNGAAPQAYVLNSYDQADRVRIATDAEGRQVRSTYDMAGRVVRLKKQNPTTFAFETWKTVEYELNSNKITDGEGRITQYAYDGFGRLKTTTYAMGTPQQSSESFEYDPNGNMTKHVTRANQTIEFWYDSRNRLIWKAQTAGQTTAPYAQARTTNPTYDQLGNLISMGTMDAAQVCQAAFWYERDGLERIRREVQGWALGSRTCAQDYKHVRYDFTDAQGNERARATKITWPDGFHVFHDLDALDRVTAIRLCSSGHAHCTGATLVTYTYDELGRRITSRTHNNAGVLTRYRWETDNDLAAVAHDAANDAVGDVVFAASFSRAGEPTAEDPLPLSPARLEVHSTDPRTQTRWTATINLSKNEELEGISIECNGNTHATQTEALNEQVIGARIATYPDSTCEHGIMEIRISTVGDRTRMSRPETFHVCNYYFRPSKYVTHTLDH